MLEKPALQDELIQSRLQEEYLLPVNRLTFLPLGADVNTAVYRVDTVHEQAYFLKLRKGEFDEIAVTLPHFLKTQGIQAVIPPLETKTRQLHTRLDGFTLILYPFIAGRNGYEIPLTDQQWLDFGAALKRIHTTQVPPTLARHIPRETFSPRWREMVRMFLAQVEEKAFADPAAVRMAQLMRAHRSEIQQLVDRARELAAALQTQARAAVLCHSDIHAGNLLMETNGALYIVDWDNPSFAPKERDLALVGGCFQWNSAREADLFYQGYGAAQIDSTALVYFRCERIIQDIAAFAEQLLLTGEGGKDREQSLLYCTSQFLPDREVEIAFRTDRSLLK